MQLFAHLKSSQSSIHKITHSFKECLSRGGVFRPREDVKFVFLCGANRAPGHLSKRRELLMEFSKSRLPYTKFFLAETFFDLLKSEGHRENILDAETELSGLSDHIIILLESESAFCELGAFATSHELRKKIVVINDISHKDSNSFINQGPIKAIEEVSGRDNVLYYRMTSEGKTYGDAIGEIFSPLHSLLHKDPTIKRSRVETINPNQHFNKDSVRFVHDLVFLTNPIYFNELLEVAIVLFGEMTRKKLQTHLGFLAAIEQIERNCSGLYMSKNKSTYFEYPYFDVFNMIASFKIFYLKFDRERMK